MIQTFEAFNAPYQTHLFPDNNGPQSVAQQLVNHFAVPNKNVIESNIQSSVEALDYIEGNHNSFIEYVGEEYGSVNAIVNVLMVYIKKYRPSDNTTQTRVDITNSYNEISKISGSAGALYKTICGEYNINPFDAVFYMLTNSSGHGKKYYLLLKKLINSLNDKDKINIYRAVSHDTYPDKIASSASIYDGIGIYWTYNPLRAEAYNTVDEDNGVIVLKAEVSWSDISWDKTLYKSLYSLSHEQEFELLPTSTPCVIAVGMPIEKSEMKHIHLNKRRWVPIIPTYVSVA